MCPLINFKSICKYIPLELIYGLLIIAYLGFYFLGLYLSSKSKISFPKSIVLTSFFISIIIFTLTGGNMFLSIIAVLSHIIVASIIYITSKA